MEKMTGFELKATKNTPNVLFDPDQGLLEIKGVSSPENSLDFYSRVYSSLDEYGIDGKYPVKAVFRLEYFNTSSAKCLYDIFRRLSKIDSAAKPVVVHWLYDEFDDDMLESGEDYRDLIPLKFEFVPM